MNSLKRLWRYARSWRSRIVLATLYSALNKLFDIAPEILIGVAVDVVVKREQSFVASLGIESLRHQILVLGAVTFFIWFFESLFEYLYSVSWRGLAQSIQHALRMDTYDRVQRLDMGWFENQSIGNVQSVLNDDINQLERFLDTGANEMIQLAVSTLVIGAVFFFLEPQIAIVAVLPVPIIFLGSRGFQKNLGPRYSEVRDAAGSLGGTLANNLTGIATIKSFTAEVTERDRISALSQAYQHANTKAIKLSSAFIPVIRMAILAGFLGTLVWGGLKTFDGSLEVGAYSILIFLTQRFLWPFTKLGQTIDLFERAMASSRRILNLLETPFQVRDAERPRPLKVGDGQVRFDSVCFAYGNGNQVFQGLDLHVRGRTTVALVGGTGSGKSTLMKLLLRFYDPQDGSISIDEQDIRQLTLKDLRSQIALVSQEVFLFHGTIRDNIAYGSETSDLAAIESAARAAEAHEFIVALPNGYDSLVGERGQKLSGGQRQRLSIARALLKQAPILVLDEATSAVDNETEEAIQRSLERIAHDRTIIVIAHRLSTIRHADRIFVLEQGQIKEQGSHDQLIDQNGQYAKLWRIQTGESVQP